MAKLTKQIINIGNRPNDGTGDNIREAFRKTNENFDTLFNVSGLGTGISFVGLNDTPSSLIPSQSGAPTVLTSDSLGFTVTQASLVGSTGITIDTSTTGTIRIINSRSSLQTDPAPTLGANLDGGTFRATNFGNPASDQDLVTRKYLYENFLNRDGIYTDNFGSSDSTLRQNVKSLATPAAPEHLVTKGYADSKIGKAGTYTVDPATGFTTTSSGVMTGPLILFRDPVDGDSGQVAATKNYVDNNGYYGLTNLYVTTKGKDFQPDIPAYKRGRFYQYAFATLNRAARYAEQLIAVSKIEVGDYARYITYDDGVPCSVASVTDGTPLSTLLLNSGANGSDQFGVPYNNNNGKYTIFPGQYVQGEDSGAIALIEGIARGGGGNPGNTQQEVYRISYVDYALPFDNDIVVTAVNGNSATFTFIETEVVPIPDFWLGYKLKYLVGGNPVFGTITSTGSEADIAGIYRNTFTATFTGTPPSIGTNIARNAWFVYSGDFYPGERVVYNTNVSALQISFVVESGEYYEQYPIKLPNNTSIRGDEFRRVIIRPARGISSSPWADTYFRRDTQIDGLQVVELYPDDYAPLISVTPSATTGIATFILEYGSLPSSYKGYMFKSDNGGQGVITEISGVSFTVDLGENLNSISTIPAGSWHLYKPINFGRHYLRNPLLPVNVLTTQTNVGGLVGAATLLQKNRKFIQNEVLAYFTASVIANISNPSSIWYGYSFDSSLCYRDAGTLVDSIVKDISEGGSGATVVSADFIANVPGIKPAVGQISTCSQAITYINSLSQKIIRNQSITPTQGNITPQVIDPSVTVELTTATKIITDLTQAAYRIVNQDPAYNPPKANKDLDVFLCNDANVIRYVSCQNHGGFMMVLDPAGQIKNKSPYTQTASSFSQSIAKQRFAGGMFVDGFAGNMIAQPTTSSYIANGGDPLSLAVTGLVRKPQVPTFFVKNGIRYEVTFLNNFMVDPANTSTYKATLKLNPLTPGGIPNTVSVSDTTGGWKINQTNLPITVSPPTGIGGLIAKGYATTNALGRVSSIVITFPGTGYTEAPTFTIGGAILNNLQISAGAITSVTVASGGAGYTVSTIVKITPINSPGTTEASGYVNSVDSNGKITSIIIMDGGTGWKETTAYTISFGQVNVTGASPVAGFIDTIETDPVTGELVPFELITAGNRSMLANDFTQVNDLGYGVFATNGGFVENVSMFSYYCYRGYYSLNGAQIRSTTGSNCYGEYGLSAEGSDPNEVPTEATLAYGINQIAYAYVPNVAFAAFAGQNSMYVALDLDNNGYPPLSGGELEINHNGIIRTYNVGSATPALDNANNQIYADGDPAKPVYILTFNSGSVTSTQTGLYDAVADKTPVTLRQVNRFKFYGFDPDSFSRPSTSISFNDDVATTYHVTGYTKSTTDNSVLVDILENYEFITAVASEQGIIAPTIVNSGTGYVSAVVSVSTSSIVNNNTATVVGDQGGTTPTQQLTLDSINNIQVGQLVTSVGTNTILTGTYVTYVNTVTNQIGISNFNNGAVTNGTTLRFNAVLPEVTANINGNGNVESLTVVKGGAGWNSTSTTITISASSGGTNATIQSPIKIAGTVGSKTIKVSKLSNAQKNRILAGLGAMPPYYYQFGVNGQLFNVVGYRDTDQSWAEIDVDVPLNRPIAQGSILKIGAPALSEAEITTRISLLRVTGHDFVDIGTGGYATTRIPNDLYGPPIQKPNQGKEVTQKGAARVYYSTTDQDGNFRVGTAFLVNQARGSVSINAPIDLTNLSSISLKKDQGPPITEFSIDDTMTGSTGGYNYRVPTEKAIVTYINRRLGINQNGGLTTEGVIGGGVLALNGVTPMAGSINMAGVGVGGPFTVTGLATPIAGSDAANKSYVDARIDLRGTLATGANGVERSDFGVMSGPLQLTGDPVTYSTVTTVQAVLGATRITIGNVLQAYRGLRVSGHPNIATGTFISAVSSATQLILSSPLLGTVPQGTTLTLDPVNQAVTKGYADRKGQFNQLRDVALTNATNTDLLMFGSTVLQPQSASGTNAAVYNTATQIVNVRNNTAAITNTPSSSGGGSDITITRTNNTATFKIVGGQGANNPITDYHINDSAAIAQSKLAMKKADTSASSSGLQSDLGLAQFNNIEFTATNGWVSLLTSVSTTTGIDPSKLEQAGNGGAVIGATSAGAMSYLSSSTARTWLNAVSKNGDTVDGTLIVSGPTYLWNNPATAALSVGGATGNSSDVTISSDATYSYIQGNNNKSLQINYGTSTNVLFGGGGNVGIGYNAGTAGYKLAVNGATRITGDVVLNSSTGTAAIRWWDTGNNSGYASYMGHNATNVFGFYSSGAASSTPRLIWSVQGRSNTSSFTVAVPLSASTATFTGPVTFASAVTFNGTATFVNSTNTVYTDNIIDLHSPPGGAWISDDGKDIGIRFHYFNSGDQTGALVLANDTKYLEWYETGAESVGGVITGTITYGTFKTGGIILEDTTNASNTVTGALIVAGGVGVGGTIYATDMYMNGSKVITQATVPASGVTFFSAGTTGLTPSSASTGSVTLGGTLKAANGGTGASGTLTGITYANGTGSFTVATAAQVTATIGTTYVRNADFASQAAALTSTLGIANGGTGATTQQGAINNIAGATTAAYYLRGNGTNVVMAALGAGDLTGTIPSAVLGNSTVYIGTTGVALNRGSGALTLDGVNISGNAATATTASTANSVAWANVTSKPTNFLYTDTNQTVTGIKTFNAQLRVSDGSASTPSIAFASDGATDTGFYWGGDGYINFASNGQYAGQIAPGGDLTMVGDISAFSDRRLKTDLNVITDAVSKVQQLTGYTFTRTDSGKRQTGVIAQDVQSVLPEAVLEGDEYLSVAYGSLVGLLIEAIKELKSEIEELKGNK